MQVTPVVFKLTKADIIRYRDEIQNISLENEKKILNAIPLKLESMFKHRRYSSFVLDLLSDVEQLYGILVRGIEVPEDSKRMILFALNYFVEEWDEIPDSLDVVGFLDDAVVVRWVVDEIKKEHPELFRKRELE